MWLTTGEGEEMAAMAGGRHAGPCRRSNTACRRCRKVDEVLAGMDDRDGGFTDFVIDPTRVRLTSAVFRTIAGLDRQFLELCGEAAWMHEARCIAPGNAWQR